MVTRPHIKLLKGMMHRAFANIFFFVTDAHAPNV